jgi:hypothetical protein
MFNWIKDWKTWREMVNSHIKDLRKYQSDGPKYDMHPGMYIINLFGNSNDKEITLSQAVTAIADYLDIDITNLEKTVVAKKKEKCVKKG